MIGPKRRTSIVVGTTDGRAGTLPGVLRFWLALVVSLVLPNPALGQADGTLQERAFEYSSARNAHQSALDARAAVQARYERALDDVEAARPAGGADLDNALAAFQMRARELQGWDRRVNDTAARLEQERRNYLAAVDDRLDELYEQIAQVEEAERTVIFQLITDLDNRVTELERPVEVDFGSVPLPEIEFDPRDGPEELRAKADLLQRRASQIEALVADIDDQLASLDRRLRREQARSDFFNDLNRFDNAQVPLGAPADPTTASGDPETAGGAPLAADSVASVPVVDLSVPERIDRLRELRAVMLQQREEVEARAQLFLERIGGAYV